MCIQNDVVVTALLRLCSETTRLRLNGSAGLWHQDPGFLSRFRLNANKKNLMPQVPADCKTAVIPLQIPAITHECCRNVLWLSVTCSIYAWVYDANERTHTHSTQQQHTVHLLPLCFIASDWSITAAVRETQPERQFWTVIWLKCINLARADVVRRCTERLITTASSSVLLVDENKADLTEWKQTNKPKKKGI